MGVGVVYSIIQKQRSLPQRAPPILSSRDRRTFSRPAAGPHWPLTSSLVPMWRCDMCEIFLRRWSLSARPVIVSVLLSHAEYCGPSWCFWPPRWFPGFARASISATFKITPPPVARSEQSIRSICAWTCARWIHCCAVATAAARTRKEGLSFAMEWQCHRSLQIKAIDFFCPFGFGIAAWLCRSCARYQDRGRTVLAFEWGLGCCWRWFVWWAVRDWAGRVWCSAAPLQWLGWGDHCCFLVIWWGRWPARR